MKNARMFAAAGLMSAWASFAGANVTILTRETVSTATGSAFGVGVLYNERETFTGPGISRIDLPHAPRHSDTATATRFAGNFEGENWFDTGSLVSYEYANSMTVRFLVSGSSAEATLNFAALSATGILNDLNVTLQLDDVGSGSRIFDIARDGVRTMAGANASWDPQTFVLDLQPGVYELTIGANGRFTDVGGGHSIGRGELSMSMDVVPAPGSLAVLSIGMVAFRRRR